MSDKIATLYDMRVTPDPLIDIGAWIAVAGCALLAFVAVVELRKRRRRKNGERLTLYGMAAISIAGLLYLPYLQVSRGLLIVRLRQAYASGRYQTYDGCVRNLRIVSTGRREEASFSIAGAPLRIDGQATDVGYRTIHHYDFPTGEPLVENAHLRVLAMDRHILRIDSFDRRCPEAKP